MIFGEGTALVEVAQLNAQGFNEGRGKPLSAQGIRFTTWNYILYAIAIGRPVQPLSIVALGANAKNMEKSIAGIDVLCCQKVIQWTRTKDTLVIQSLKNKVCDEITVF